MPKILIIDDDVELCAALGKFLRRQGHDVITATDGQMGLAAALQGPDLIICDLAMPVLNGHGVLEALRQDQRLADTPFIFLSGLANREMIRRSRSWRSPSILSSTTLCISMSSRAMSSANCGSAVFGPEW